MDLSTTYLGMKLPHPLMAGASPFANDMDGVRRLEDAGSAAIVLDSLFEEQIEAEAMATTGALDGPKDQYAESLSYLPEPGAFRVGPDEYLQKIANVKKAVKLPVIASLNGTRRGGVEGWLRYAKLIEQAGADALELNLYDVAADAGQPGSEVEDRHVSVVREVRRVTRLPLAVKLSPFYSSLPHFAVELRNAGADGLILFNRFFQPDIDLENLAAQRVLRLSDSSELPLRVRWLAILSGRTKLSLAASGGVHRVEDVLKAVMAGADAVQMVSALFRHGVEHLKTLRQQMEQWLKEHEYESLRQAKGSMSLLKTDNPSAFTRANYVEILQNWEASLKQDRGGAA